MTFKSNDKEDLLNEWFGLKLELHKATIPNRNFRTGEVWWSAVGENLGVEINGKNAYFSRPVLIYKKLSKDSFIGIPMTSQPKNGSWYVEFTFQGRQSRVILAQITVMSTKRLYNRIGQLDESDFQKIKFKLQNFLNE